MGARGAGALPSACQVFVVENGKLTLVEKKEVKGAVWTLQPFQGKLLVSIGSKLMLYRWTQREDDQHELVSECGHHGHIIALYTAVRGDFIAVGDLMKSISLIQYKAEEGAMEERARDINAHWMTAVDVLDDDHFLARARAHAPCGVACCPPAFAPLCAPRRWCDDCRLRARRALRTGTTFSCAARTWTRRRTTSACGWRWWASSTWASR